MKISEMFEGKKSSLRKSYNKATDKPETLTNKEIKEIIEVAKEEVKCWQKFIKLAEKELK